MNGSEVLASVSTVGRISRDGTHADEKLKIWTLCPNRKWFEEQGLSRREGEPGQRKCEDSFQESQWAMDIRYEGF